MILTGKFTLGEPCCPYTIEKYTSRDRQLVKESNDVYGRIILLLEVRQRLLKRQEKLVRLLKDDEIDDMTSESQASGCDSPEQQKQESYQTLRKYQRQRSLVVWHDHATLLNRGFLMVIVHTLYDKAVYFTSILSALETR